MTNSRGENRTYRLVLQCRVRPTSIRVCNRNEYWVINKPEDIRPYGICLYDTSFVPTKKYPSSDAKFDYGTYKDGIAKRMKEMGW